MRSKALLVTTLSGVFWLSGCSVNPNSNEVFTLYRDSKVGLMRIHVATFDSTDGRDYNEENCQIARDLFQNQPFVTVKYWCEMGRYRK